MIVQMEAEVAAEDMLPQEAPLVRFFDGLLAALIDIPDLAVDVVVPALASHRIGGDRHALDQNVRVVAHDVAVFERPGLALVGIAHEVLLALELLRHEAPFEASRKSGAAATTQ